MNTSRRDALGLILASTFAAGACSKKPDANGNGAGKDTPSAPGAAPGPESGAGKKPIRVALLPKKKGVPYFSSCAVGAEEAARELGIELIYDGPTDGSAEKAASMIERWAAQGVEVIAVSPNDPGVVGAAMRAARAKGCRVITWDADGEPDSREFMVSQATAQDIGFALVDTMARDISAAAGSSDPAAASGEVAIITATLTAANQNEWIAFMRQRLAAYPGLKLVDTRPSNEDQRVAFQAATDLMGAYPKLRGIWGISSVSFPAAAEAVKQAGKAGRVEVLGLSTPNDMRRSVDEGTVRSVILWNTKDLGYLTVRVAWELANGTLKPGDTSVNAGRLAQRRVEGDRVVLGDILIFTKDNIAQYDF